MTASTEAHTAWCHPAECAPTQHSSTPWILGSQEPTGMHPTVTVYVTQHRSGAGPTRYDGLPYIDMTVHTTALDETDTGDQDYTLILTPERALALGHLLTTAGQTATRHPGDFLQGRTGGRHVPPGAPDS